MLEAQRASFDPKSEEYKKITEQITLLIEKKGEYSKYLADEAGDALIKKFREIT
jgi:hypothetical protein